MPARPGGALDVACANYPGNLDLQDVSESGASSQRVIASILN